MWRHVRSCKFVGDKSEKMESSLKKSNILLYSNQYSKGASEELTETILERMNKDSIYHVVRKDELITSYGSFLMSSKGSSKGNQISQRLRLLGRLLQILNANAESKPLLDYISPNYFDKICEAVKKLGDFSMQSKEGNTLPTFEKPSVPLKLGYCIDQCCELVKGVAIRSSNEALLTSAERFSKLYKLEWSKKISGISLRCLDDNKFEKVQLLPLTEDLLKVRTYLKEEIPRATATLKKFPTNDNWRWLAEITGIRLTMLNRRRASEVFGMLTSKFDKCCLSSSRKIPKPH